MYRIKVHHNIQLIIALLYRVGFWHRQDEETPAERRLKLFYPIFYCFYPISLIAGLIVGNGDNDVQLMAAILVTSSLLIKLWYLIWKKKEILQLLNRMCNHFIDDRDTFTSVNNKLDIFVKFVTAFAIMLNILEISIPLSPPLFGTERRQLFFQIGFPLDWRNDEFSYWVAFTFVFAQSIISGLSFLLNVLIWYLMANCAWGYEIVGQQIKDMGERRAEVDEPTVERRISNAEKDKLYLQDFVEAVKSLNYLNESINELDSFLSNMFAIQLVTSGMCICGCAYCLAFIRNDNSLEGIIYVASILYNILDIFMTLFFGNEIKLGSDSLLYRLYESNWIDRSRSIKRNILIFGEFLMQPHQLMALKIYPLTLETFKRILNSAYSMFNILKNLK